MKRSEMVGRIYDSLLRNMSQQDYKIVGSPKLKEVASAVLSRIEQEGMLPPPNRYYGRRFENKLGVFVTGEYTVDLPLQEEFSATDLWEPEDEN